MYDELKERCRACSQGCIYPSECSYFDKPPLRCMRQLLSEAADAIEELSKQLDDMNEANIALYGALQKWIPVTERLPEHAYGEGDSVLTVSSLGSMRVLYFDGGNWCYPTGEALTTARKYPITHWMPLPKGPEKE